MDIIKFEEGKTYYFRSIGDSQDTSVIKVVRRSDKSIWTANGNRLKIKIWHDGSTEYVMPYGEYSKAPMVRASNPLTDQ